jgi:hypothetical protein
MHNNPEELAQLYPEFHAAFHEAMVNACNLSYAKTGIPQSSRNKVFYGATLFTKLCTTAVSISKLCPHPSKIGDDANWDYRSVASLTRDIIECYLVFFYLCIEECTDDEWTARLGLMDLHDHMSRVKLFDAMGSVYEENEEAVETRDELLSFLKSNCFFKDLSEKRQKNFLKGNEAFFMTQDEIILSSGETVSKFRFKYRFLSNHIHSFPMGFYRMGNGERGRGLESRIEIQYTGLCLNWISEYLSKASKQFEELFAQ